MGTTSFLLGYFPFFENFFAQPLENQKIVRTFAVPKTARQRGRYKGIN